MRILVLPVLTVFMAIVLSEEPSVSISEDEVTYPEHLTGAFTGGFGEQTCRSCHFDYDLNPEGGSLDVSGIRDDISAGEKRDIRISVEREDLARAGFQLSARYQDGSQAGRFEVEREDRVMFSKSVPDSLQYVQHSKFGSKPTGKNKTNWTVIWQAPDSVSGPVIFNVAANAANGDQSEFGDYIYTEEIEVEL